MLWLDGARGRVRRRRGSSVCAAAACSPAHFAERHGLILIIAIGESLVAIGIGAPAHDARRGRGWHGGARARRRDLVLACRTSTFSQSAAGSCYAARSGADRDGARPRHLHVPAPADGRRGHPLRLRDEGRRSRTVGDELGTVEAVALCGGPSFYLFSYVALRYRVSRTFGRGRLIADDRLRPPDPSRTGTARGRHAGTRWPPSGAGSTPTS